MSERVILPPHYPEVSGQLVFLAGPIQGVADWQKDAAGILLERRPDLTIASPRRQYLDGEFVYESQVDWETFYLRRAAERGAIMFWLAKELEHMPERAYAQTTRFELAEWKIKHEREGIKLVIGIEDGFSGAKYIRYRCTHDCPTLPIYNSLEETCAATLDLLNSMPLQLQTWNR